MANEVKGTPPAGGQDRSQQLLRDVVSDAKRLADRELTVARSRLTGTGRKLALPALAAAAGVLLGAAGLQLILARPAVPPRSRSARRRMTGLSLAYLVGGASLIAWGLPMIAAELTRSMRGAQRALSKSIDTVEEAMEE